MGYSAQCSGSMRSLHLTSTATSQMDTGSSKEVRRKKDSMSYRNSSRTRSKRYFTGSRANVWTARYENT